MTGRKRDVLMARESPPNERSHSGPLASDWNQDALPALANAIGSAPLDSGLFVFQSDKPAAQANQPNNAAYSLDE
jgi:hypothetical protein